MPTSDLIQEYLNTACDLHVGLPVCGIYHSRYYGSACGRLSMCFRRTCEHRPNLSWFLHLSTLITRTEYITWGFGGEDLKKKRKVDLLQIKNCNKLNKQHIEQWRHLANLSKLFLAKNYDKNNVKEGQKIQGKNEQKFAHKLNKQ